MSLITTLKEKQSHLNIGGKATQLTLLESFYVRVPKWAVIPEEVVLAQLPLSSDKVLTIEDYHTLVLPEEIVVQLQTFFGEHYQTKTYAVRSSASDEDGQHYSFAGQFETHLHVSFDQLEEKIKSIWKSVIAENVLSYRQQHQLPVQYGISVIIQEMIEADVAGVAFGADPVSGSRDKKIISSVYGLGEGLVSGELNADTFTISESGVSQQLTTKTHGFFKHPGGNGIVKKAIEEKKQQQSSLSSQQLDQIGKLLDQLSDALGTPQDIEFAYSNEQIYLLQTRPITTLQQKKQGEYTLWDNSNIVESYPGITTPLTFSFIIKMYEMVYLQFVQLMGAKEKEIAPHVDVFANTLGLVRGRVYYNLLSWYKMLAMVPGYSINARFMEKMMGVKERFELKEDYQMSKGLAWFRVIAMLFNMIRLHRRLPQERHHFQLHLNKVMDRYEKIAFETLSPQEIIAAYNAFEKTLLLEWKAPLINDFFAMIWFGLLEKQTTILCPETPNLHNDLLCGSQDIISVEPIHRSIEISRLILQHPSAKKLFTTSSPSTIWEHLCEGEFPEIKAKINEYIDRFGERCVGELKLETISYAQNPTLFIRVLKAYVEQNIVAKTTHNNIEDDLRSKAEQTIQQLLRGKFLKKKWFNYTLQKARDLVSNRENLRYERTRGFGMVRKMFSALGQQWHKEGLLQHSRDIFYMELAEIKYMGQLLQDADDATQQYFNTQIAPAIEKRKAEFDAYRQQDPPIERFFTYGNDFSDAFIYSTEKREELKGDLKGIGCCPGKVKGKVNVVTDPTQVDSLNGDILVTSSTDPGWVTLFPTASAIIVERGSLLSHSAIVSREMGIPCIVSVTGLLRTVKTGNLIEMDGSTGEIKLLENG